MAGGWTVQRIYGSSYEDRMGDSLDELMIVRRMLEREEYGFVIRGLKETMLELCRRTYNLSASAGYGDAIAEVNRRIAEMETPPV